MTEYVVLSGESYLVKARSKEEAEEKYFAYINGEDCSCGDFSCECAQEFETTTMVIEC